MTSLPACPCGSGERYLACCQRFHSGGEVASTATLLMKSRFAAFALHEAEYLLRTWHPETRPEAIEFDERLGWLTLEIVESVGGGPFDTTGIVEFRAEYRRGNRRGALHERSQFRRMNGQWLYLHGEISAI